MKNIVILGSTGSIGTQTLELVRADSDLNVVGLAALKSVEKLFQQILEFKPEVVCMYEESAADQLKVKLEQAGVTGVKVLSGMEGLKEVAAWPGANQVVISVVGMIGILPTIAAIQAGKDIALANKETLVTAGHLIMPMVKEYGVDLMPVDSEHSAIYQCLVGERRQDVDKLLLTASGGPFRQFTKQQLLSVTPEEALKHPNWSMGAKITIDCSTMVNKALEVMEAHWLFDVPVDSIQVVVQPKSIIHSMVQFIDGAVKAQLGVPSMLIPIEYAIYKKNRHALPSEQKLDFKTLKNIEFCVPDMELFPGLRLGIEAGRIGGSMPTVFNAANEELVAKFLNHSISFLQIPEGIEKAMGRHSLIQDPSLDEIFATERDTREFIRSIC